MYIYSLDMFYMKMAFSPRDKISAGPVNGSKAKKHYHIIQCRKSGDCFPPLLMKISFSWLFLSLWSSRGLCAFISIARASRNKAQKDWKVSSQSEYFGPALEVSTLPGHAWGIHFIKGVHSATLHCPRNQPHSFQIHCNAAVICPGSARRGRGSRPSRLWLQNVLRAVRLARFTHAGSPQKKAL